MSVALLLLCVLVVSGAHAKLSMPPEMAEMVHSLEETCKKESGVAPEILEAARNMDFKEDQNFKCFIKCMMFNFQVLGEDGELDHDVIEQALPEEIKKLGALDVVEKCRSTKGADICDTAYQLIQCFMREGKHLSEFFV